MEISWTRKSSIARVMISSGKGEITINRRNIDTYFGGRDILKVVTKQPFEVLGIEGQYDVDINVKGGLSGQAGAIRLGISRGIEKVNPDLENFKRKWISY